MKAIDHIVVPVTVNDDDDDETETKLNHKEKNKRKRYSCFQWIELIAAICIPCVIGVYTIVDSINNVSIAAANRQKDIEIAEQSRQKDHDLAKDQQLENILNDYQTFLGKLILDVKESLKESNKAKEVAQFKTLTVLQQLDAKRLNIVIRSLYNAQLITLRKTGQSNDERSVLDLRKLYLQDLTLGWPHNSLRLYPTFQRIDWHYLWLPESIFTNVSFRHANFICVDFSFTYMYSVDLSFTATGGGTPCIGAAWNSSIDFLRATLINTTIIRINWVYAALSSTHMISVDMSHSMCRDCHFEYASLNQVNLSFTRFERFSRTLSRPSFQDIKMDQIVAHLTTFNSIDFSHSNWNDVNASAIEIIDCIFHGAIIKHSSLIKSTIEKSAFQNANLSIIDLSYAKLHYVSFINSIISNANLSFMICNHCTFINVTFENIIWINVSLRNSYFRHCHLNLSQLINNAIDLFGTTLSNETNEIDLGTEEQHIKKMKYYIRLKTGDVFLAGTDADIYLRIVAKNMDIEQIQLLSTNNQVNNFEQGQIDRFTFESSDLGNVSFFSHLTVL